MLLERESAIQEFIKTADSSEHSGKVLLVSGEAGIGKTALLEHMRNIMDSRTNIIWSGSDPLLTPQPYAPFHDIAHSLSKPLLELLESSATPSKISHKIASTLYASLENLSEPTVLVIEDVHWADHASLDLLKFLVRRISFVKCMLCLTYRDDEITFEHPLSSVLSLAPSAHTNRIQLKALSIEALENLVKNTWYNAQDLYKITSGNPFFVSELLASNSKNDTNIPSSICAAIGARLANLAEDERHLLLTLSLIPYSIPVRLIDQLFKHSTKTQGETLAMACVARKLLQCDMLGEFRFRHELVRLAALSCLSVHQQKRMHTQILTSLETLNINANLAWLTHHAQGALDATSVLKYAPLAAANAANLGAHKEAASYFEKALKFVEYADTELAASLHENWAYEVSLTSHMQAPVIEARRAAITLWRALGRHDKIGENLRSLSRLYWYQGQSERAEHYANEAIKLFEQMPASSELAMAYSMRSQLDMLNDRTQQAVLWGEKALALEQQFNNALVKVHALTNIGTALLMNGDGAGEEMLKKSLAIAQDHGMHEEAARVYTNYSDYCVRFKRLDLAESLSSKGIQFDTSHDLDSWTYYLVGIQAQLRLEQGRLVDAETIASGVQEIENQTLLMKLPALIVLARARARMGMQNADELLQQALDSALIIDECQYIIPARFAIIEHAWLRRNFHQARPHIQELLRSIANELNPWQLGELAAWISRIPNMPTVALSYQELPVPYQLELAGESQAAYEAWQALGMPFNAAIALLSTSSMMTKSNRENCLTSTLTKQRQSAFIQAFPIFESMQAKAVIIWMKQQAKEEGFEDLLPKIRRGPYAKSRQHPVGLTSKEQAVIKLLVTGASNQDIARALSRSQRTIENHVSSILSKLNVESRIEAMLRVQNEPWLLG